MKKLLLLLAVVLSCVSAHAQNIEGQIVASQFGEFQVPSVGQGFSFPPASCQIPGGNKNFAAFTTGVPIKIVDDNPSLIEVQTPVAVFVSQSNCSVSMATTYSHSSFYLTSGTGGLQEALINGAGRTGGPNTIILNAEWYALVAPSNPATVISSVTGSTTMGLVDVTTAPYTYYEYSGGHYVPIGGGGGAPSGPAGGVLSGTYPNPGLSASLVLPPATTATTQTTGDNSTKVATDAFVLANGGVGGPCANALTFSGGGSGSSPGATFNCASPITLSYNSIAAAPLASPAFSGTPTAPTPAVGDNSTKLATTAFVSGTISPKVVNGVANCAAYPGATVAEQINNCNVDALALTNGNTSGVMDLRGLGNSNFLDTQAFIGNTSATSVTAIMPANGTWKPSNSFSSTSQCLLRIGKNVTILGSNAGANNGFDIVIPGSYTGSGLYAAICTDNTVAGYLKIVGIDAECEGPVNASGHCVDIEQTFDNVDIEEMTVLDHSAEIAFYTKDICCASTFKNINANCNYTAGCTPMYMDSPVSGPGSQEVKLISPSLDHPGAGEHALVISDTRNPGATKVDVDGLYSEMSNSDTTTSAAYVNGTQGVSFENPYCNYEDTASTAPCVEFNYGSAIANDIVNGLVINNAATYPVVAAVKNDAASLNRATDGYGFLGHYDASSTNYFNTLNLPNSGVITGRNVGNTADIGIFRLNANNLAQVLQPFNSTVAGAASQPSVLFTGGDYNGGTGTTTVPFWYLNSGATAPTTWSTNGTWIGINPVAGFTGNYLDFHAPNGGLSVFSVGYNGLLTSASIVDSGLTPSANPVCANGSGGALVNTGCNTTSTVLWSSLLSPTSSLSLAMAAYQSIFTYNAATGTADLFKLTDTTNNTGTGILAHFTTASGSTEIPWQADANGTGWQITAAGRLSSTDAINNAAASFSPGSGGAATCPTPASGSSFLCTNANNGISYSNNGAAYSPLSAQAVPFTITSSASPAVNLNNGSVQTITLSANATATVSNITAGISLTMQICQPASGGPFTWSWPAGIHGGFTIGTTASDCSMQEFRSFNGTTLVAINPGVINVAP